MEKTNIVKNNRGITLITLVVTIIILIILAGVSINLLFDDYGIITRAQNAKQMQQEAQVKENIQLKLVDLQMEKNLKGKDITTTDLETIITQAGGEVVKDAEGNITGVKVGDVIIQIEEVTKGVEIKQNGINELKDFLNEENFTDEEIIVDKEKLEILLQNTQAIDYIIDKKELLTLINQKEELKELFLNNKLAMSKLSQEVNENEGLVPNLKSNTTALNGEECGEATQSSEWYGRSAYKAFNRNVEKMEVGNCWQATDKAPSEGTYIQYKSLTEDTILNAKIGTWDDNTKNTDTSWTTYIRGSQDGQNWTKISKEIEITVEKNVLKYFEYEINDFNQYKYYQVYFSGSQNNTEYVHRSYEYSCSIMFLQFYGIKNNDLLNYYVNS